MVDTAGRFRPAELSSQQVIATEVLGLFASYCFTPLLTLISSPLLSLVDICNILDTSRNLLVLVPEFRLAAQKCCYELKKTFTSSCRSGRDGVCDTVWNLLRLAQSLAWVWVTVSPKSLVCLK